MKKILLSMVAALSLTVTASADEGMWLLPLLQKMNGQAMSELGCKLTPEQIYSVNNSSIKDAVVQFGGGCTAEIISDEGLLVTNHHCGYGSIQGLSTPEHNYLEDGYWAMNRTQELPVPGLTVKFLQRMDDVSKVVDKAVSKAEKDGAEAVEKALVSITDELVKKAEADYPNCNAQVKSFYNSNVYYLIVYKIYRDVRFVGAPPASVGKFGGDTDNWMWPRQTCDFSMFRVYAGKDNEPADFSENNVPLRPRQSLKVSLKGMQDGDFAMIMGYPGSTQRFMTADQLKEMIQVNDIRIAARTVRQDIMWEARMADPVVNLQYASKYASSSNGWKKWIGMKLAFDKLGIIERQEREEDAFTLWINEKKARTEKFGGALKQISDCVSANSAPTRAYTLLNESLGRIELASFANLFSRTVADGTKSGLSETEAVKAAGEAVLTQLGDYNEALDRKEAKALIRFYKENAKPGEIISLDGQALAYLDIDAYVDRMFDGTLLTSEEKLKRIGSKADFDKDPACKFLNDMLPALRKFAGQANGQSAVKLAEASKAYTAGQLEWKKGQPSYPDANSTCRLTYGSVKSYSPKDGVIYKHYTTLKGVMEKEDPDNYEFRVPARLKEIYEKSDFGDYATAEGELPACFLINCDITGGNSGSPVMDAEGNLVGLAFDGNWESMSSDVMFEPDLQRCICVDIRYVLLLMDKFGGAGYLRNEMNIVK